MKERKRYVVVGTGSRGCNMFAEPLLKKYSRYCELVGLFDHNLPRMQAANELLGVKLRLYTDFQNMLRQAKPDAVIIASRDSTHAEFIIQTLAAGKRAISEKPLCVDARQCREILAAARRYARKGAHCLVTHNMRYAPPLQKVKQLIKDGVMGDMRAINFQETLDRRHGADYFRRWHRVKKNSGGLLVHKASHHFDGLNWLVESKPAELVAQGGLLFYGKNGPFRHKRCEGCPHARKCEFYVNMWQSEFTRRMYKDAEHADGYLRDGCVFDREIDIEDNASVLCAYQNGIRVTYSINAFASYEGMHLQIEGTRGRLELKEVHDTSWLSGGSTVHGLEKLTGRHLHLFNPAQGMREVTVPEGAGGHGGADSGLLHDFFGRPFDAPLTEAQAPLEQAVQAVLIGHAANVSMAHGSKPVNVQDFLRAG